MESEFSIDEHCVEINLVQFLNFKIGNHWKNPLGAVSYSQTLMGLGEKQKHGILNQAQIKCDCLDY